MYFLIKQPNDKILKWKLKEQHIIKVLCISCVPSHIYQLNTQISKLQKCAKKIPKIFQRKKAWKEFKDKILLYQHCKIERRSKPNQKIEKEKKISIKKSKSPKTHTIK